jgi:hypothetical protein
MTEGISFLYEFDLGNRNLEIPGANILSVTSQAAGDFDKANLTSEPLRQTWRSDSILTWQEIVIEAEVESEIDTFAILGHNFTEDAVVQLQANIANNFAAPPVTITIPYSKLNMVHTSSLGAAYKFYRIRVLDPTNPCGYVEIGRIVGGRSFIMRYNEDITDDFSIDYSDMSKSMKTEGFFRVSTENVKVRTLAAKFQRLNTSSPNNQNFLGLRDFYDYVGTTRSFLAVLDRGDPGFCSIWGQLRDIPSENYTINRYMSQSIKVEEQF